MTFTQFSLPAQGLSGCSDYVQVRNGTTSLSPLMGTYCNRGPGAPIEPMSNSMFVKFHSDASANSYTGFSAAFQAGMSCCQVFVFVTKSFLFIATIRTMPMIAMIPMITVIPTMPMMPKVSEIPMIITVPEMPMMPMMSMMPKLPEIPMIATIPMMP